MKIGIVSPYIASSANLQYYQSQQINLAAELTKLGVQVDIITAHRDSNQPEYEVIGGQIKIFRLPTVATWTERFFNQSVMAGLWKMLKKGAYDLIQSSDDYALSTLVAGLYALFNKSRLIIYQGIYHYSLRKTVKALMYVYDFFTGFIMKRTYCMAVCKTKTAGKFLQKKGFNRIRIISAGVNTSLFYPGERRRNKDFELLSAGQLIPQKNYCFMLKVFEHLIKVYPNVRLTIIGSGPDKERIEHIARETGVTDKLRLIENVPNRQMRDFYTHSDLFLLFSKNEIFGMVILEAMACGCPVMSTPTPGAVDIISDNVNGYIVSGFYEKDIAEQINRILQNQDKLSLVRQRALKTSEQYSWAAIARQYYELYLEVMAEKDKKP